MTELRNNSWRSFTAVVADIIFLGIGGTFKKTMPLCGPFQNLSNFSRWIECDKKLFNFFSGCTADHIECTPNPYYMYPSPCCMYPSPCSTLTPINTYMYPSLCSMYPSPYYTLTQIHTTCTPAILQIVWE